MIVPAYPNKSTCKTLWVKSLGIFWNRPFCKSIDEVLNVEFFGTERFNKTIRIKIIRVGFLHKAIRVKFICFESLSELIDVEIFSSEHSPEFIFVKSNFILVGFKKCCSKSFWIELFGFVIWGNYFLNFEEGFDKNIVRKTVIISKADRFNQRLGIENRLSRCVDYEENSK